MHILEELQARGLISQITAESDLKEHLSSGSRTLYCGVDPTGDSMHVGHMIPFLVLERFRRAGHNPIALIGGATGFIGDPSFKANERSLLDETALEKNVHALNTQMKKLLKNNIKVVNNFDWISKIDIITFLRDIGKYYSVNEMLKKESVKNRIERDDQGISYTEFTYSILQGLDFTHLNKTEQCTVQIGGNDQWGNIVSGTELTRRKNGQQVFALSLPLLTDSSGKKFGKSEGNAVHLDPTQTSPYRFYQFWLNQKDNDVEKLLNIFTFLSLDDIKHITQAHLEAPHKREGQRILAQEVTRFVHGEDGLLSAERITSALFSNNIKSLTHSDLESLAKDGLPNHKVGTKEIPLIDALIESDLASSKREARDFITGNAVSINSEKVSDLEATLTSQLALFDKYVLLKRGKKNYALLQLGE